MTRRAVLYGYQIQNGAYVPDHIAAPVVHRIYSMYECGASYNRIADLLNHEGTIYLEEQPIWNKHIVKRILQNPKYTGTDCYPALIKTEQYQQVQDLIARKMAGRKKNSPKEDAMLWSCLSCGVCGGDVKRTGGGSSNRTEISLKCSKCGQSVKITRAELTQEILAQYNAYNANENAPYAPSEEVIRLNNAINRALEQAEDLSAVIDLILQGVSARYDCCPVQKRMPEATRLTEIDWTYFREIVSAVDVAADGSITLIFHARREINGT